MPSGACTHLCHVRAESGKQWLRRSMITQVSIRIVLAGVFLLRAVSFPDFISVLSRIACISASPVLCVKSTPPRYTESAPSIVCHMRKYYVSL